MLIPAIVLIAGALVAYTAGVWSERRSGTLHWWHAGLFGLGLTLDASGTWVMSRIADAGGLATDGTAGVLNQIMAVTGALALALMALHLLWAVVVLVRDRAAEKRTFHRFSLAVWGLWLLPYVTGMLGSML